MNRWTVISLSMLMLLGLLLSPVAAQEPVTIRVMTLPGELSETQIAAFEAVNPDIHVELVPSDQLILDMSIASGDMPDLLRVSAIEMPSYVESGLVLDLTDYFDTSAIISLDDIAPAADYYKFDDRYYGLPKDWSLDFSIYIYNPAFDAAGIPIPSTSEPLTYAELADVARHLTVRDGDTVTYHGFLVPYFERLITSVLVQNGISMFNDDYSEMRLTDNPLAIDVVRFFYDLTLEGVMNPDRSWIGRAWSESLPMFQWGYWYGGSIGDWHPMYENLTMLPAPTWDRSLPRLNTTIGPTGMVITAGSQHPDEAYRFFEWYIVGDEGRLRTQMGGGAPSLLSMVDLLPHDTPFNIQRLELLQSELPYSNWVLPVYPYRSINITFDPIWEANMALALQGEIDFETFVSNLQEEINLAILNEQLSTN